MSRDQRPGRVKMIDASPETVPTRRIGDDPATAIVDATASPAPEAPAEKSRTMMWSGVFLFACVAGAVGVTLLGIG